MLIKQSDLQGRYKLRKEWTARDWYIISVLSEISFRKAYIETLSVLLEDNIAKNYTGFRFQSKMSR